MQKINHIFSLKQWEQVQDSLSDLTGMAVLMVDYRGVPVTKHSHCCEFCRKVRESPVLKNIVKNVIHTVVQKLCGKIVRIYTDVVLG